MRAVAPIGAAHAVLGEAVATGETSLELRAVPHSAATPFGADLGPEEVVGRQSGPDGFRELGRIDDRRHWTNGDSVPRAGERGG
ncbi:hypothetical protein ACFU6S_11025 [Streptomyces sp. NPDC057456]|uniref:hypothetical protein n=1 Tax=Streptomyces sp. NPDC057456 TaxID=3346139 RepID=UPI0036BF3E06